MKQTTAFEEKLARFLAIINLPLRLGWSEYLRDDTKNIFYYFWSLGLITRDELQSVYVLRGGLEANRGFRSYWKHIDYHFAPTYYQGRAAVDVGAGWGAITYWLLLSGARAVYAIGDEERTRFVHRLFDEARRIGLLPADAAAIPVPRFVRAGQDRFGDEIPDESTALVLFNDVFEHITPRALPFALRASYRALQPGGRLVSLCPNGGSRSFRVGIQSHWDDYERSIGMPQRLRLIHGALSQVSPEEAESLAQATRGLDSTDFMAVLERFRLARAIPLGDTSLAPVNIEMDVVEEGIIVPPVICEKMRKAGFEVFAYPVMTTTRRSRYFQPLARVVPAIFWWLGLFDQSVAFVGRKPGR